MERKNLDQQAAVCSSISLRASALYIACTSRALQRFSRQTSGLLLAAGTARGPAAQSQAVGRLNLVTASSTGPSGQCEPDPRPTSTNPPLSLLFLHEPKIGNGNGPRMSIRASNTHSLPCS